MRALLAALLGGLSGLGLARRCWLRFLGGFARPGLARRCWLRFLGGFSWLCLARRCWLRLLGRLREAEALRCWLCVRTAFAIFVCLPLCLVFRRPALALVAGSQAESDHYLTIT